MAEKVLFCWSSGKDSTMALYTLQQNPEYQVISLLTTITEDYDRISMYGVRRVLVEQQAKSLGLSLEKVFIPKESSNETYESRMQEKLLQFKADGVISVAFGDIFLEDLKEYRENNLQLVGMQGLFPIWKRDTKELARSFIDLGFKAIITCVDSQVLDGAFAGRKYDAQFLADLPPSVDPCGENGEFHSFVYDGPSFQEAIKCERGEIVLRNERFYFCDVVPV